MGSEMSINQNRIIRSKNRVVEVTAAPGSGKTYTLIRRAVHLLATVPAEQILVLSFSNASVREIRQRMRAMSTDSTTGAEISNVTVQTAHAFAKGLIKQKSVLSEKRAIKLLARSIKAVQKDCKKGVLWPDVSTSQMQRRLTQLEELLEQQNIRLVLNFMSVVQASRKKVSESVTGKFDKLAGYVKVLCAIRNKYSAIKKAKGDIDYGDMLVQAVKAIEGGASIPFTHILVDEYQDCSAAQTHLLTLLANLDGRSLMVFGDSCQGIYGFAGANYTALSGVLDDVRQLSLPVSRRLTSQTAALASAVAQLEDDQAIQTTSAGKMPVLVRDDTLDSQTKHIVRDIQKLIAAGTPTEQIAVLARTKALLHPVEQSLLALDVQTDRMGHTRHRKHVLAVLRLVRIVERLAVSKSKVKPERLHKALPSVTADDARWKKETLNLAKVGRMPSLESRYKGCAAVYLRLNGGVRKDADLRADVNRWLPKCRDYKDARSMRAAIKAMMAEEVVTGTIHAAKGREWDHVLIVGATDGLLPIHFATDDIAISQERNMLYVAITRARKNVRLYHAPTVNARSGKLFESASRFLDEPAVRKTLKVEKLTG